MGPVENNGRRRKRRSSLEERGEEEEEEEEDEESFSTKERSLKPDQDWHLTNPALQIILGPQIPDLVKERMEHCFGDVLKKKYYIETMDYVE